MATLPEFPDDLLDSLAQFAESHGWSASTLHQYLRPVLVAKFRERREVSATFAKHVETDKRLKTYHAIGRVRRHDERFCITPSIYTFQGLDLAEGVMHRLVLWALPSQETVRSWGISKYMRGARVALSNDGVATFHCEGGRYSAELHCHLDPARAQAHLDQLQRETRGTFQPGDDGAIANLVRLQRPQEK